MYRLIRFLPAVSLVALLVMHSGGMWLWLVVSRHFADSVYRYDEMQNNDRVHHVVMSRAEYAAAQIKEDELRIGDKMFDVLSVQRSGDKLQLCLFHDMEEEDLLEEIGRWLGSTGRKDSKGLGWLGKLLSSPVQCENPVLQPQPTVFDMDTAWPQLTFSECRGFTLTEVPPPDLSV